MVPTHKWHFEFTDQAKGQLSELPSKDRMAVFRSVVELLISENPLTLTDVTKLSGRQFEGQWRKRQGKYRIFFTLEDGEIVHEGFTYKGRIVILDIEHRSRAYKK